VEIVAVDPLIVGGRVAFPPHQILEFPSSAEVAFAEDLFYFPLFLPFDDFGRRFEEVRAMFGGFLVRR